MLIFINTAVAQARSQAVQRHLIRFFLCYLRLYRKLPGADNRPIPDTLVECGRKVPAAPFPSEAL